MIKIKSKLTWNKAIKQISNEPQSPEDWAEVVKIYRSLGGKVTVTKTDRIFEAFIGEPNKESIASELKKFLVKWIKNPIVLGIALYFLGSQIKKYISK